MSPIDSDEMKWEVAVQLSKRLQAVANLVGETGVVADIGTDHGYIPVFLVSSGKTERAIAMDVNVGPLARAQEHIRQFGLEGQIETRLSDGLSALQPGEAQSIVIAGMGGALMARILADEQDIARTAGRLVLQPQSELFSFRQFLAGHGYRIVEEDMVYEDGKYYSMMAVEPVSRGAGDELREMTEAELRYGPLLLAQNHPILHRYLLRQREQKQKILENLGKNARQDVSERETVVEKELREIENILGHDL